MSVYDEQFFDIERYQSNINYGLRDYQVKKRIEQGLNNYQVAPKFKSISQIFLSNIFTYFNILNFILSVCVLLVGSFRNAMFVGVAIWNIFIGIFQELKARSVIKKLFIVSQPVVIVIRNGKRSKVLNSEIVLDDIVVLDAGNQVPADTIVKQGLVEVNEAIITGESNLIVKKPGDMLISGSFIVSGNCIGQVEKVGENNYASQIMMDVGKNKKTQSEIMKYINIVVKMVSILIIPIGIIRFYKEFFILHNSLQVSVVSTVASVIGMIPEGIVLLTSIALAVGVIRLSKLKTLTQDLFALETLAQVDVLCFDKTGTITEGNIEVNDIITVNGFNIDDIDLIMKNICINIEDKGPTIDALKSYFVKDHNNFTKWGAFSKISFSSERKWSGINFDNDENVVLGAPEILLGDLIGEYQSQISEYLLSGKRVLVVGKTDERIVINCKPKITPICFIIMSDKIRCKAMETIKFFNEQGVDIKIVSGDNAIAVAQIAKSVNIAGYDKYIDATNLETDDDIKEAIKKYNIFGRMNPYQKRNLIKAYKESGKTVGMIGDGVNDILALQDADCSIAIAGGSDAARQISKFVLLDSNFSSVPNIVMEGRKVINNIQRAASMFLIKNIYSFALSLILLFFATSYPFQPIQLTLLGSLTVGIPSFFLVLKHNKEPMKKNFLKNVLKVAFPTAIAIIINIVIINIISRFFIKFSYIQVSTMAVVLTGICNLITLFKLSKPINFKNIIFIGIFVMLFLISIFNLKEFFSLSNINLLMFIIIMFLSILSYVEIDVWNLIDKFKIRKKRNCYD